MTPEHNEIGCSKGIAEAYCRFMNRRHLDPDLQEASNKSWSLCVDSSDARWRLGPADTALVSADMRISSSYLQHLAMSQHRWLCCVVYIAGSFECSGAGDEKAWINWQLL